MPSLRPYQRLLSARCEPTDYRELLSRLLDAIADGDDAEIWWALKMAHEKLAHDSLSNLRRYVYEHPECLH